MILTNVTMTGADDSIDPQALLELSKKYPFVEWAILVSWRMTGTKRFPTHKWLNNFADWCAKTNPKPNVSVHVCGRYVQGLLNNYRLAFSCLSEYAELFAVADRVQLNTHAEPHNFDPIVMNRTLQAIPARAAAAHTKSDKEIIFQFDGVNGQKLFDNYWDFLKSPLYDVSHGAGVLPETWPYEADLYPIRHGYAGGLSPDNVVEQLGKIDKVVPKETKVWIDMETHVRSNNDKQFDLVKVEAVLEQCQPWV